MQGKKSNIKPVQVFSQWSRKAYAVFASIGRQVQIGHLNFDICVKSLLKGKKSFLLVSNNGTVIEWQENSSEEEPDLTLLQQLENLLIPALNTDQTSSGQPDSKQTYKHSYSALSYGAMLKNRIPNSDNMVELQKERVLRGEQITFQEAVLLAKNGSLEAICEAADEIRAHFTGNAFDLCSITNAKSGKCSEDCKWCTQSAHYKTDVECYEMVDKEFAIEQAIKNEQYGVHKYSLVTSGKKISNKNLDEIIGVYSEIKKKSNIHLCASMGLVSKEQLIKLKEAGIEHYHCNLETAPSFFPELCSTHSFDEKVETINTAQEIGLDVCSGGIIGMGETLEQRIELAFELNKLNIKSIPVNILMPLPGTPLEHVAPLCDDEVLLTLAMFRFVNPQAKIRFAGGRNRIKHIEQKALRSGVNAALVGDLLTTVGSSVSEDIECFKEAGYKLDSRL